MSDVERAKVRLRAYESKTSWVMATLAVAYFLIFMLQVLWLAIPISVNIVFNVASIAIWIVFIVDLTTRTYLAPNRIMYLAQHPLDVVAVVVPMFRILRVLRVFTAGQWFIARGRHLAIGRTYLAIGVGAAVVWFIAALAFYDVERGAPDTLVDSFGDALWWSIVTMSTVGYGDVYPVTPEGRLVAAALMIVGISLLGVITATVASWFVEQTRLNSKTTPVAGTDRRRLGRGKINHVPRRIKKLSTSGNGRHVRDCRSLVRW